VFVGRSASEKYVLALLLAAAYPDPIIDGGNAVAGLRETQ
jgi:hypothetical protein